jgi:hypothetical protein
MTNNTSPNERPRVASTNPHLLGNGASLTEKMEARKNNQDINDNLPPRPPKETSYSPSCHPELKSSSTETPETFKSTETPETFKERDREETKLDTPQNLSNATPILTKEDKRDETTTDEDENTAKDEDDHHHRHHHHHPSSHHAYSDLARHRPWPLLPSPKTPLASDATGDSSSWKHQVGDPSNNRSSLGQHYNPSPPNGWPQRSPLKSDHNAHNEEASFTLFTHSFDTLSETGNYLREMGHQQRPEQPRSQNTTPLPKKIDIGNGRPHEDSDSSVGDISPIKLTTAHRHLNNHRAGGHTHEQPRPQRLLGGFLPQADATPMEIVVAHQRGASNQDSYGPMSEAPHYFPTTTDSTGVPHHNAHDGWRPPYYQEDQYYDHPYAESAANTTSTTATLAPSNPFYILRSSHEAFAACSYLLPCVRDTTVCPVNLGHYTSNIRHYHDEQDCADSQDTVIATRRVEAAIYAFGGFLKPPVKKQQGAATSIFRHRKTLSREFYDVRFHQRYFVNGTHISWEVEENPPVHLSPSELPASVRGRGERGDSSGMLLGGPDSPHHTNRRHDQASSPGDRKPSGDCSTNSTGSIIPSDNQQKMKYRYVCFWMDRLLITSACVVSIGD